MVFEWLLVLIVGFAKFWSMTVAWSIGHAIVDVVGVKKNDPAEIRFVP